MAMITERSTKEPLLNVRRIGHGTLGVIDLGRSRRFYEEVLGFDVIQTSPISMMIRKGTDQVYAVVEVGERKPDMARINHNGLDVDTDEDVDAAYETLTRVKDEYGLKEIRKPGITHGDYCFYFVDQDENWWEIVKTRPGLGHAEDFSDPERDLTGRGHEFVAKRGVHVHMHDPEFRKAINESSPRP